LKKKEEEEAGKKALELETRENQMHAYGFKVRIKS
jgi:hypothetical protein